MAGEERSFSSKGNVIEAGGMPAYTTSKLCEVSPAMKTLEPIGKSHAGAWINYWSQKGFLNV